MEDYNIIDECELIADSRLKERDKFVKSIKKNNPSTNIKT